MAETKLANVPQRADCKASEDNGLDSSLAVDAKIEGHTKAPGQVVTFQCFARTTWPILQSTILYSAKLGATYCSLERILPFGFCQYLAVQGHAIGRGESG